MAGQPSNNPTPKQLAAQARAQSEAAERKRERTIRIVGGIVVLLVVGGLLAIGIMAGKSKDAEASGGGIDATAPIPAGVQPDSYGVPVGTGWTADNADKLPTLEIWEDFQCPACAQVEAVAGAGIKKLGDDGKVKLLLRPATFLDKNLPQSNNSSARATAAWGCAIDAGKASEYHAAVFAAHPAQEGDGFTDEQLLALGEQVGLAGADFEQFSQCVAEGKYLQWATNSNIRFGESPATGTPTGYLNGTELDSSELADVAALEKKIAEATQK